MRFLSRRWRQAYRTVWNCPSVTSSFLLRLFASHSAKILQVSPREVVIRRRKLGCALQHFFSFVVLARVHEAVAEIVQVQIASRCSAGGPACCARRCFSSVSFSTGIRNSISASVSRLRRRFFKDVVLLLILFFCPRSSCTGVSLTSLGLGSP
jgi:hypothetical protein